MRYGLAWWIGFLEGVVHDAHAIGVLDELPIVVQASGHAVAAMPLRADQIWNRESQYKKNRKVVFSCKFGRKIPVKQLLGAWTCGRE
jgi:hypothetical protein